MMFKVAMLISDLILNDTIIKGHTIIVAYCVAFSLQNSFEGY